MKRLICFLLCMFLLCPAIVSVQAEAPITVKLNGEVLVFDVPPMLIQDRTMVPLRVIFEALGATVDYEDATKKITATMGDTVVTLRVDTPAMYVNGTEFLLDVPATVVNDRTLVPVRAISEAFDCDVQWDGDTNTVLITKEKDIFDFGAPEIDFTGDDGTKSKLHYSSRLSFEQNYLPTLLFGNTEVFKELILNDSESIMTVLDQQVWTPARDNVVAAYLLETDKTFSTDAEDVFDRIDVVADKYELWAEQNFAVDFFMLNDTDVCVLLNMADIGEKVVLDELDRMLISPFVAIVYETDTDTFRYFCLEKSLGDAYMLCGYDKEMAHLNFGICEKDKRAFVQAIKAVGEQ